MWKASSSAIPLLERNENAGEPEERRAADGPPTPNQAPSRNGMRNASEDSG